MKILLELIQTNMREMRSSIGCLGIQRYSLDISKIFMHNIQAQKQSIGP